MNMNNLPSLDVVKAEVLQLFDDKKVPRMCSNCVMYDKPSSKCTRTNKYIEDYKFCLSHEFQTERLEKEAIAYMTAEQLECDKIENILAMMLTCAGMTTCLTEDFSKRTRRLYDNEKNKNIRLLLRKDLNIGEDVSKAFDAIQESLNEIDKQYRFYIYPLEKRLASKKGKFNVEKSDNHLSNQFTCLKILFKVMKKVLGRKDNLDRFWEFIDSLEDSPYYAMEDKDINHYELKK